jgi:hypothetical protein
MAKQPIYQLLVEIDFADKTESQREDIMRRISNSILEIAETEKLEVVSGKEYGWERTKAYDTVDE